MVTCPWCGTSYQAFQSNCSRCGGPIHPPGVIEKAGETPLVPPPVPRPIANSYVFKLMGEDGWSIAGLVFLIIGGMFTPISIALTLGIVTAFVGLPFMALGLLFLVASWRILTWRYRESQKQVQVLRWGEATLGKVIDLTENVHVQVNGRFPWVIRYQYEANGQGYTGSVTTLSQPGMHLQPGRDVYVLYLADNPSLSSLYPHP